MFPPAPILYREVYGKPLIYLDNGASAQKPQSVIEAMDHAYRFEYANVHRGLHYLSNTATQRFEEARETVRRFLNAPSTDEIIFTRNATEAINLVASSFGAIEIGEGDEIVLSIMEHHSNIVPWHFHRERKGAVLKWAPNGNPARTNFKLQAEYFRSRENGTLVYDDTSAGGPFGVQSDRFAARQSGWYVQGIWQFMPRWRIGYRYDALRYGDVNIGIVANGLGPQAADFPLLSRHKPAAPE